jgi:CYTH domain-containing protein
MEVERKFLVDELPRDLGAGVDIDQGYVACDGTTEVRLRRKGATCLLTIKTGSGLERTEREVVLSDEQLDILWPATEGRRVTKTRFEIDLADHTAELDRYSGDLDGLVTVEVEFASVAQARSFEPPSWFGREVTDDSRYANRRLAVDGLP